MRFIKIQETAEKTSQTEPDNENVACWTGEPNYTRYFIIRLFKPQEFSSRKLKFKITYGATTYVSKNFESVKAEKKVKINEQQVKTRKFKSEILFLKSIFLNFLKKPLK